MKSRDLYLGVILVLLTFVCCAQKNIHIERGHAYYETFQYFNALNAYERGIRRDSSLQTILRLADCYKRLDKEGKAVALLRKGVKKFPESDTLVMSFCNILKINLLYLEYDKTVNQFYQKNPLNSWAQREKATTDSIAKWRNLPLAANLTFLNKINTEFDEISPFFNGKELYFSSNRENLMVREQSQTDGLPHFDLYVASIDTVTMGISSVLPLLFSFNTPKDETSICFTSDGQKAYFTQNASFVSLQGDSVSRPKLFCSESKNGIWSKAKTFIFNDLPYSYAQPFVEGKEKWFFFSSDLPGGYGGADIYVSINIDEKWTDPINLGPYINTPGNEVYPFVDEKGNLYFSSDYHPGWGGYDIFMSTQTNGDFGPPKNLGIPINSSGNDLGFHLNKNQTSGFFSSNRKFGKGKMDIYYFHSYSR